MRQFVEKSPFYLPTYHSIYSIFFSEKVIYFLLLDRKKRKPSHEDDTEVIVRNRCGSQDPPRKRIDSYSKNGFSYTELSQGSPITPRRKLYK